MPLEAGAHMNIELVLLQKRSLRGPCQILHVEVLRGSLLSRREPSPNHAGEAVELGSCLTESEE